MNLRKLSTSQLYEMLSDLDEQEGHDADVMYNRVQAEIDWREDGDYFAPEDTPSLQPEQFMEYHG